MSANSIRTKSPRQGDSLERRRERLDRETPGAGEVLTLINGAIQGRRPTWAEELGPRPEAAPWRGSWYSGLAIPPRFERVRFLSGVLMGLLSGLAFLMAIALLPGLFGFYPMVVLSGSMEPTLRTGDIAVVQKLNPYNLQIGDVVTYSTAGGNVTHRIVGLDITPQGPFFLMRGDANLTADPRPVPAQALVGKVLYRIPRLGFLVSFTDSVAGRILLIAAPLLLLALIGLRRAVRGHWPFRPTPLTQKDEPSDGKEHHLFTLSQHGFGNWETPQLGDRDEGEREWPC